MNATHSPHRQAPPSQIARRAVDLALDGGVSLADGAHHLCHLANRDPARLRDALQQLPVAPDAEPEEECARILLRHALSMLTASSSTDTRALR